VSLPVTSSRSAIGGLAALARVFEAAAQIVIPDGIDWHVHCLSPMPFPGRTEHQMTDPAASSSSKNGTFSGDPKDGQFLALPAGRSRDRGLAYIDISTPSNFHCSSIVIAGRIRCSAELFR
jgi:hypothetical protein